MTRYAWIILAALCVFPSAVAGEEARSTPTLDGKWSGSWFSDSDGHHGPLHANLTRINDSQYRVRFHGRFMKIVPFFYSVVLDVVSCEGDTVILEGTQRLGPVFGEFKYRATATCSCFNATFTSNKDFGRFELSRNQR